MLMPAIPMVRLTFWIRDNEASAMSCIVLGASRPNC